MLIYSDLGSILNINEHDIVEKLAKEFNLNIRNVTTCKSAHRVKEDFDALKNYKRESKVMLYEIKRI